MKDYIVIEESAKGSFKTHRVRNIEIPITGWINAQNKMKALALKAHLERRIGLVYIREVQPGGNPIVIRGGMVGISDLTSMSGNAIRIAREVISSLPEGGRKTGSGAQRPKDGSRDDAR